MRRKAGYSPYKPKTVRAANCVFCGQPLSGKQRLYCSDTCAKQAERIKRQQDNHKRIFGEGYTGNGHSLRTCVECGKEFSIELGHWGRPPSKCPECRDVQYTKGYPRRERRMCAVCGEPVARLGNKYCSADCRSVAMPTNTHGWSMFICERCGKEFPRRGDKAAALCWECRVVRADAAPLVVPVASSEQRIDVQATAASWACDYIDPETVFDRDGWRCGICGKKVNRKASPPALDSPTMDHIVPISKGGTHTLDNLQCAHFGCNCRKSNNGGGQMRLGLSVAAG